MRGMKQTLQLRLGQHLTMTPQLQQAIRLLQLSTLDLKQEIQEALDSNLMLESEDEGRVGEPVNGTDQLSPNEADKVPPGNDRLTSVLFTLVSPLTARILCIY